MKFNVVFLLMLFISSLQAQPTDFTKVHCEVHFDKTLQDWDGFGFNYVEVCQTPDYKEFKQEYGGFSILPQASRDTILQMVFGEKGLKVGLVKMFLDAIHQPLGNGKYNHTETTEWMRYFVKNGLEITRKRGSDLQIITTLYGPPAWAFKSGELRSRDLNPEKFERLTEYEIDWIKFLLNEGLSVKYFSLHNQGDQPFNFPLDGSGYLLNGKDYNAYWSPQQVVEYVKLLRKKMDENGLQQIGVTPGETSRWHFFQDYGYAPHLSWDDEALNSLGLISSHGFHKSKFSEWFGEQRSAGTDLLRSKRPELHAWTTSSGFLDMSVNYAKEVHGNIYTAKVNGYIPWAGIQRPEHWINQEWNPGTCFYVREDGSFEILQGYYLYKQISRAGQSGMKVATAIANWKHLHIIAFSSNGTSNPDAFVVMNLDEKDKALNVFTEGSKSKEFEAFRTNDEKTEQYNNIGKFENKEGLIQYLAPARSVTTFFGVK